jgi:hypothetical protein
MFSPRACKFLASPWPDDGMRRCGPEVTPMSGQQQEHTDLRPALAGGAGDDLELDQEEWAAVCPREITPEQWSRFEGYMLEIFTAMGMLAGTVSTTDTRAGSCGRSSTRPAGTRATRSW